MSAGLQPQVRAALMPVRDVLAVERIDPDCVHVHCKNVESVEAAREVVLSLWPSLDTVAYDDFTLGILRP